MQYLTLLLLILSFCASTVSAEPPHPPFRKVWSYKTDKQISSSINENLVNNKIICYYTSEEYGAVDIDSGKCLWKKQVGNNHILHAYCSSGSFQIISEQQWNTGKGMLYVLDPKTGSEISTIPLPGMSCCPEIKGGILYCLFKRNMLTAIDIANGKRLWAREIKLRSHKYGNSFFDTDLNATGNSIFIKNSNLELICVDSASGRTRWSFNLSASYPSYTTDCRKVYLIQEETITAHNIDNGRKEWTFNSNCRIENKIVSSENLLVFWGNDGVLYALGTEDGKVSWSQKLPPADYRIFSNISLIDDLIVLSIGKHLLAFDQKGRKIWEYDSRVRYIYEIMASGRGYLFNDAFTLLRYEEGKPPEVPDTAEGKKALAENLVSRFYDLDDDEKYLLSTLGNQAFDALLSLAEKHLALYEKASSEFRSRKEGAAETADYLSNEYSKFDHAMFALKNVTAPEHTTQLFSLLSTARNPELRFKILFLLAEKGDEKVTAPYFIKEIERIKNEKDDLFFVALHALENSSDKAAVDFMAGKLSDQKASIAIREAAYHNLGRTGGERGARAVLNARDENRTIPSIDDFAGFDTLDLTIDRSMKGDPDNRLMELMTDSRGNLWGVASSCVLGSFLDLWLLQSDGRKWKRAFFAGSLTEPGSDTIESMIDNIDSACIPLDSDKDGWTDLVEKRLGTDPNNKDTDGDGLIDSEDRNPLAAPRPLTDKEKILRAAFESRYCFSRGDDYKAPCLVDLPEGIQPFEFYGFNWVIIPQVKGTESPLSKCRSLILHRGMAIVYFRRPSFDFDGNKTPENREKEFILWNADKTEAKLSIITHYGSQNAAGYDIHLKKFGDEWIVIKILKTWVS